jgi:hypothetical protein
MPHQELTTGWSETHGVLATVKMVTSESEEILSLLAKLMSPLLTEPLVLDMMPLLLAAANAVSFTTVHTP